MKKTLLKIITFILKAIVGILIIGFIYEQISRIYFNGKRPSESDFVTINGRKLHYHKEGNSNKGTVIFEGGMGSDYLHWQEIQPQLAKHFTTISYDRAGILWSDKDNEKTLQSITNDLNHLLEKTNCPKPYIIVAHSLGGAIARQFITEHKNDMAGVVLVDVSHPLQLKKSSEELKSSMKKPPFWLIRVLNTFGIIRFVYTITPFNSEFPQNHWFNKNVTNYFYRITPGFLQEWANDEALLEQAEAYTDFGTIPLVVITGTYPKGNPLIASEVLHKEYLNLHHDLQKDLLHLSPNSRQISAFESGHYVTIQQPELIVESVLNLNTKQ